MKRASQILSETDRARLKDAVREAENKTSGEIVCVLAAQSGDYDRAEDMAGLWLGGLLLAGAWLIFGRAPPGSWGGRVLEVGWVELLIAFALLLAGFIAGAFVTSRVDWLKRLFTTDRQMKEEVERAAARMFFAHGLRETRARTGIIIYVSVLERMVRVLGDRAISEKLSDADWGEVCQAILAGIRSGKPAAGLEAGLRLCGEKLARHFPRPAGDTDELGNDIRIID